MRIDPAVHTNKILFRSAAFAVVFLFFENGVSAADHVAAVSMTYFYFLQILLTILLLSCIASVIFIFRLRAKTKWQDIMLEASGMRFCVCDREGRVLAARAESTIQGLVSDAGKLSDLAAVSERDLPKLLSCLNAAFENGVQTDCIFTGMNRNASFRRLPHELFGEETVLWSSRDISDQLARNDRQEKELQTWRNFFDGLPTAGMITDGTGHIQQMNPAMERLLGYSFSYARNLELNRILKLLYPGREELYRLTVDDTVSKQESGIRLDAVAKSGEKVPVFLTQLVAYGERRTPERRAVFLADRRANRRLEQRCEAAEKVQTLMSDLLHAASFQYDVQSRDLAASPTFKDNWPLENGRPVAPKEWVSREDLPSFEPAWDDCVQGKSDMMNLVFQAKNLGSPRRFRLIARRSERGGIVSLSGIIQDVTDRKDTELLWGDCLGVARFLLNSLPCLMFVKDASNEYRYLFCSSQWRDMVGVNPENVIGKNDFEWMQGAPKDAERLRQDDLTASRTGQIVFKREKYVNPLFGKDETLFTMERACNTPDGRRLIVGITMDMSKMEIAAQENDSGRLRFYEELVAKMPVSVFVKNEQRQYVLWNNVSERHTGCSRKDVLGHTDNEIAPFPGLSNDFAETERILLETGETQYRAGWRLTASGRQIYYDTTCFRLESEGKRYLARVNVDSTAAKELENEKEEHIRKLNAYMSLSALTNTCLRRITGEQDFDKSLRDMLTIIGSTLDADRSYIYVMHEQHRCFSCDFEWTRENVLSLSAQHQNLPYDGFEDWIQQMSVYRKPFVLNDSATLAENQKTIFSRVHISDLASLALMPIHDNDAYVGFIGVDYNRKKHEFTETDLQVLQSAVSIYLIALQRKRHLDRILESSKIQRQIFDTINVPIFVVNPDFSIVHANPAMLRIAKGGQFDSCVGKKCSEAFCGMQGIVEHNCPGVKVLRTKKSVVQEVKIDGRSMVITMTPILENGNVVQMLESVVDVTEITRSREMLKKAVADAGEAARAKSMFFATMSHELRTPLNAVIGYADVLKYGGRTQSEIDEAVNAIQLSGNTLLNLINDILDLSKLEAGQMTINPELMNLTALIAEQQKIFQHKMAESNLTFTVNIPDNLPGLYLDSLRLRQILLNLIGNAAKFTHEGGIEVSVSFSAEEVSETGSLTIVVRDTGIGISPDMTEQIFEPFIQQRHENGRSYHGTGLGLPICRRLAGQMDGTISVKSIQGKGSSFIVMLPHVRYSKSLPAEEKTVSEVLRRRAGRVLLVDDTPLNLNVLSAMMRNIGFEVDSAVSGPEALAKIETFHPRYIFTDLWMAGMNGVELAKTVRQNPLMKEIYVYLITADTEIAEADAAFFDGILVKPVTTAKIAGMLDAAKMEHPS